jgi:GNAT superfamily N-acetyltransferase
MLSFDMIQIHTIELPAPGMEELQFEARAEGHNFIERLVKEWTSGENRFDAPGELLCGCIEDGVLVAVGGLNRDPFADADIGRIRRVYVRPGWRKKGIGKTLVEALVEKARENFRCVRLRSVNPDAARLYERIGFLPIADAKATHMMKFR